MRVGVIGAGTWGGVHARVYRNLPGVELAAVADTDGSRAAALAGELGAGVQAFSDHRRLLDDRSLEAVSVVVPDTLHKPVILDAVRSGKHVLIEKPLTTDVGDARECVEEMRLGGRTYMVNFHLRWMTPFYRAHQLIREGKIGEPLFAAFEQSNTLRFVTETLKWSGQSNALWFLGIHSIDMLQWLFGRRIEKVFCLSQKRLLRERGLDTEDYFASTLSFEGGGSAFLENSWIAPSAHPSIAICRCRITGTEGSMEIDAINNRSLSYTRSDAGPADINVFGLNPMEGGYIGSPAYSIAHFVRAASTGTEPGVTLEDGFSSVAVVSALLRSASSASQVAVETLA